ncbi:MAG: hypothetical protein HC767_04010 [Akkermansiaceae bacterium]|nr:hypothetical protein [Akkermansiaceae bacterium]
MNCENRATCAQAWAAELADGSNGGMVNGFPSSIDTVAELVDLVATIIMQVSAVHCSLNYLQCASLKKHHHALPSKSIIMRFPQKASSCDSLHKHHHALVLP